MVGSYVPLNNVRAVYCVEQAFIVAPKGLEIILMGDLNVRLGDPRDKYEEDLATAMVDRGLFNMIYHFMPR